MKIPNHLIKYLGIVVVLISSLLSFAFYNYTLGYTTYCSPFLDSSSYNSCMNDLQRSNSYYNYLNEGIRLFKIGNKFEGVSYLEKALNFADKNDVWDVKVLIAEVYLSIGNDFFNGGNFQNAINYYNKSAQYDPDDENVYYNLGTAYLQLGEYDGYDDGNIMQQKISYLKSSIEYYKKSKLKANTSASKDRCDPQIGVVYFDIGNAYIRNENYLDASKYYKEALNYRLNDSSILYNLGICNENLGKYDEALNNYTASRKYSSRNDLNVILDSKIELLTKKKNQKTNDEYNYDQFYLEKLNIYEALDKLPNQKKQVIIAVIDDGLYLNHPDLNNHIRVNTKEIPGNRIDDDKNGYVDDYNGWNFVLNTNNVMPSGAHGTMVAGIMAANTNNNIGIAGIVPNVKIMPLNVFSSEGASDLYVKQAVKYAIDNGANIINLSLGGSQFQYTSTYNDVFKEAYSKGIIVVVSAGNGDEISSANVGVNTSVNKLSPVCNEIDKKTIIGVGALDKKGNVTKWSNYGNCVDFYTFGEGIVSTSIDTEIPYNIGDGTSFSSPIIAGIIGLGFNKYGKISPNTVYDALKSSLKGNVVDASKYLDYLSVNIGELKDAISWMYKMGLTSKKTPDAFNYKRSLRRDEAAKFFVEYAKNVLHKKPDYSRQGCIFNDLNEATPSLRYAVTESCQLGLFNGKKGKFNPGDDFTNAQAVTVFIRLIDGYKKETGSHYANQYLIKAQNLGITEGTLINKSKNFDIPATRGDVAIMLYKGSKIKK